MNLLDSSDSKADTSEAAWNHPICGKMPRNKCVSLLLQRETLTCFFGFFYYKRLIEGTVVVDQLYGTKVEYLTKKQKHTHIYNFQTNLIKKNPQGLSIFFLLYFLKFQIRCFCIVMKILDKLKFDHYTWPYLKKHN